MACQVPTSYLNVQDGVHDFTNYLLENVPEFQELHSAKKLLLQSSEALKLWNDIQERKNTIEMLAAQSLPVSQQQQDELNLKLKALNSNSIAMRYLKALNASADIAGRISYQIEKELGVSFVSKSGCC